jgi:hypothetical protein
MEHSSTSTDNTLFSLKKLRWFLVELKDNNPDVRIKFRLKKDGWQSKFYTLAHISDESVVILDNSSNQLKFIGISDITQFAINKNFKSVQAQKFYDIWLEV